MEDLNELLKQTVTAAEDGGEASEMWIRRGKRSHHERERQESSTSDNEEIARNNNKQTRSANSTTNAINVKHHTFDAAEMRHKIEEGRQKEVKQLNAENAVVSAVSAQYSARMAHNIIQYVLDYELGGKHNINATSSKNYNNSNEYTCVNFALAGSNNVNGEFDFRERQGVTTVERGFAMMRADIAVERASRSNVSFYKLQHISNHNLVSSASLTANTTHSANRYGSSVHWSKLPDDVIEYRRSLQPCSIAFDLDGGWTGMRRGNSAQLSIELRRRIKPIIMAGLQGKSYIAQTEYAHLQPSTQNDSNATVHSKNIIDTANSEEQEMLQHLQIHKGASVSDPTMDLFVQNNKKSHVDTNSVDKLKDINTGVNASNKNTDENDGFIDDNEFAIDAFLRASSSSSSESESESEQEESVRQ